MTLKSTLSIIALSGAALAATPASAAIVLTVNGALTANDPTYNRPLAGSPPAGLSGVGTSVFYDTRSFTVASTGSYTFLLDSGAGGFDTFLGLYSGSFNAGSPLTNALQYNDDLAAGNLTQSGFTRTLTAGVNYIAIFTSFDNGETGAYTFTLDAATPGVPEPATWAMMLLGFGALGYSMRRRPSMSIRFAR